MSVLLRIIQVSHVDVFSSCVKVGGKSNGAVPITGTLTGIIQDMQPPEPRATKKRGRPENHAPNQVQATTDEYVNGIPEYTVDLIYIVEIRFHCKTITNQKVTSQSYYMKRSQ